MKIPSAVRAPLGGCAEFLLVALDFNIKLIMKFHDLWIFNRLSQDGPRLE